MYYLRRVRLGGEQDLFTLEGNQRNGEWMEGYELKIYDAA